MRFEDLTSQLRGTPTNVPVYSLLCICDSPAACKGQNIKQFNGELGCNWSYHKGEVVEKGNGFTRVYPLESEPEPRTDTKHRREVALVIESGNIIHGVKGPSPLMFAFDGILFGMCRVMCIGREITTANVLLYIALFRTFIKPS